jgi:restriction endonuclease
MRPSVVVVHPPLVENDTSLGQAQEQLPGEQLFVETKSTVHLSLLRDIEHDKIRCGDKHFEAIKQRPCPAEYHRGTSLADVLAARGP